MLASIAVRGVYRRFAALSEEEKAQVVEKVKQKLKEKYPEATDTEAPAEEESSDDGIDVTPVEEGTVEPSTEGDEPVNVDNLDWSDEPAEEGETETPADSESKDSEDDAFPEYSEGEEPTEESTEEPAEEPTEEPVEEPTEEPAEEPVEESAEESTEESTKKSPEEPAEEPEESAEESPEESSEETDDKAVSAEPGTPMGEIADDIAEDVDEIREDGKVHPSRVLDLLGDMMKMVTLLVRTTPPEEAVDESRVACRIAEESVAERVALTAARGQQLNRKDKDLMSDTGGSSKGPGKEPNLKPPRDDVRKPFRTKNKPSDERDLDTDTDPDLKD
jgi:hypothetical protein